VTDTFNAQQVNSWVLARIADYEVNSPKMNSSRLPEEDHLAAKPNSRQPGSFNNVDECIRDSASFDNSAKQAKFGEFSDCRFKKRVHCKTAQPRL
jgi:hypothetical protein